MPKDKHSIRPPRTKYHLIFWSIVVAGIAMDLWSKHAVFKWLPNRPGQEYTIIEGFCKFVLRLNAGAAFSIASGQRNILVAVSIIAMVVVIGIFFFGNIRRKISLIALAMFAAGIVGNLYDRAFNNGLVRDFIDVYYQRWHWPAFNVADSLLCTAVGLMFIASLTSASSEKPAHRQKQESQDRR